MKKTLKIIGYVLWCIGIVVGIFFYSPIILFLIPFFILSVIPAKTKTRPKEENSFVIFDDED